MSAFGSAATIGVAGGLAGPKDAAVPAPGLTVKGAGFATAFARGATGTAGITTEDELVDGIGTGVRENFR